MNIKLYSIQKYLVGTDAKFVSVSAGPGSGKTEVIGRRIEKLLSGGVDGRKILCLSHTKSSAMNLSNRLEQIAGIENAVTVRTFHSFALDLHRRYCDQPINVVDAKFM